MLTYRLGMTRDRASDVFSALANAARRRMLDLLVEHPGMHVAALGTHFKFSDVAVLKHVRVLEAAGLIVSQRDARERRLYFNAVPIQEIYDRWTTQYSGFWASHVADIKARVEARALRKAARRA